MWEDLLHKISVDNATVSLNVEIGRVNGYGSNGLEISFYDREGIVDNVILLGTYKPVVDSGGLILYAGKSKYPCFLPFYTGSQPNNEGENKSSTNKNEPQSVIDTSNWINIEDAGKSVINSGTLKIENGYDNHWGTPDVIKFIIQIAVDWENSPDNINKSKFIIHDISRSNGGNFESHVGLGHRTGRAVDGYTTDNLQISSCSGGVDKIKTPDKWKAKIAFMNICYKNGATHIMHTDSKWQSAFPDGTMADKKGGHRTHFHISWSGDSL